MTGLHIAILATILILSGVIYARHRLGFGRGTTISSDELEFRSPALGLVGRPDRLIKRGRYFIPEERKSGARFYKSHKLQLGTYLLLIEDETGVRPPHGFIVLGNGKRIKVPNTRRLTAEVMQTVEEIRSARQRPTEILHVDPPAAQCRSCGQRHNCTVAKA